MTQNARDLVVFLTHGIDHELSSVALTIALGGLTAGLKVSIFLTSAGVDIARRGAADKTHVWRAAARCGPARRASRAAVTHTRISSTA
jgi:predicted peroxiredoxin